MSELKKHIYDKNNGLHYTLVGDYYIPDLQLPEEERSIGKYGRMHRKYMREYNPMLFNDLLLSCQFWTYAEVRIDEKSYSSEGKKLNKIM